MKTLTPTNTIEIVENETKRTVDLEIKTVTIEPQGALFPWFILPDSEVIE